MAELKKSELTQILPTSPNAGRELDSAAQKGEMAGRIEGEANRSFAQFVAKTGIEGYFDIKKAQLGQDIEEAVSYLEGYGDKALEEQNQLNLLDKRITQNAYDATNYGPFSKPTDVGTGKSVDLLSENLRENIDRFTRETVPEIKALNAQILDRDTVVRNIAAITKKYIAQWPGMGSLFRQKAAEITGISNIDSSPLHTALTTASAREKLAQATATKALELETDIAKFFGYSDLSQISDKDRNVYMGVKRTENVAADLKRQSEIEGLRQDEADKIHGDRVLLALSGSAYQLSAGLLKLITTNQGPGYNYAEFNSRDKGNMFAYIEQERQAALQLLNKLSIKSNLNPNRISAEQQKNLVTRIDQTYDQFREILDDSAKFDYFTKLAEGTKMQHDMFMQSLVLANPFFAYMKELGIGPDIIKMVFAEPGTMEEKHRVLTTRFGKAFADGAMQVINDPKWSIVDIMGAKKNQSSNPEEVSSLQEQAQNAGIVNPSPQDFRNTVNRWRLTTKSTYDNSEGAMGALNSAVSIYNEKGIYNGGQEIADIHQANATGRLDSWINKVKENPELQEQASNLAATGITSIQKRVDQQFDVVTTNLLSGQEGSIHATGTPGGITFNNGKFEATPDAPESIKKTVFNLNKDIQVAEKLAQLNPEYKDVAIRTHGKLVAKLTQERDKAAALVQVYQNQKGNSVPRIKELREQSKKVGGEEFRMVMDEINTLTNANAELEPKIEEQRAIIEKNNYLLDKLKVESTPKATPVTQTSGDFPVNKTVKKDMGTSSEASLKEQVKGDIESPYKVAEGYTKDLTNVQYLLTRGSSLSDEQVSILRERYNQLLELRFDPKLTEKLTQEDKERLAEIASQPFIPKTDAELKAMVNGYK